MHGIFVQELEKAIAVIGTKCKAICRLQGKRAQPLVQGSPARKRRPWPVACMPVCAPVLDTRQSLAGRRLSLRFENNGTEAGIRYEQTTKDRRKAATL